MNNIAVVSPLTGEELHQIESHSPEQVLAAFATARQLQPEWQRTPANQRAAVAKRLHRVILDNQDALLEQLQAETGKSRAHAFEELAGALGAVRYYAAKSPKALRSVRAKSAVPFLISTVVDRVPVGVVGVITPWNYPLALTMMDVIPALLAGNAVVQKADNQTAKTTKLARDLAEAAGLPSGLWQVVQGDPELVGNAVVDNADYVAFTGSTATGRKVGVRAAARLIGFSLELGGKNPMIVLPGANAGKAAELALAAAFGNSGQLCVSIERVYAPQAMVPELLRELEQRVAALKLGTSDDFEHDLGPLTSQAQLARVKGKIADGVAAGARVVVGGEAAPALGLNYYLPTVVAVDSTDNPLLKEEVFGPVIAVVGYKNVDEAVQLANDSEYGLNSSVVGPVALARQVASRLQTGSVNINEGYRASMATLDAPMGGMKQSGFGRRSGIQGLLRYTEPRTVSVARTWPLGLPTRGHHYRRMAPLMSMLAKIQGR